MRTKRGYAEQLIKMLYPNPTQDSKLTYGMAMAVVSQARDAIMKLSYYENLKMGDMMLNADWLSEYRDVPVTYDEKRCEGYLYMPVRVISMPHNIGVYQVKSPSSDIAFYPVTPTHNTMYNTSPVKDLQGRGSYYLLQNRIIFPTDTPPKEVDLLLLAVGEDIGEDEYFPIDTSKEQMIFEYCQKLLMQQRQIPEDTNNDSNSN
jgi:hypothetical protein